MLLMAGEMPTHAHSQYVIVPFLQSGGVGDKTRDKKTTTTTTEAVKDHCQVRCSIHSWTNGGSLSFFLIDSCNYCFGLLLFIWLVRRLAMSSGKMEFILEI